MKKLLAAWKQICDADYKYKTVANSIQIKLKRKTTMFNVTFALLVQDFWSGNGAISSFQTHLCQMYAWYSKTMNLCVGILMQITNTNFLGCIQILS